MTKLMQTKRRNIELSFNIVLIGMPGCGKSTMGRTLGRYLKRNFIDSDEEIQRRTGVSIPHIFDVEGEEGFRARETAVITDLMQQPNNLLVVATGGGAVLREVNRDIIKQHGVIVYLNAGVHDLWLRTRNDKNRPLLQTDDPKAKLIELFKQRDPLYRKVADIIIPTSRQSVGVLMLQLVRRLEEHQQEISQQKLQRDPC